MGSISLRPTDFTADPRAARRIAREIGSDAYVPIIACYGGREFEVAEWSRFHLRWDSEKISDQRYIMVEEHTFFRRSEAMIEAVTANGVGILVFKDVESDIRYVLAPGRERMKAQAALFGTTVATCRKALLRVPLVWKAIDSEIAVAKAAARREVSRLDDECRNRGIQLAELVQHVHHLERELARRGAE